MRPLIAYEVGNGDMIHCWFDNWHSNIPLLNSLGPKVVYTYGIPIYAKLSTVCLMANGIGPQLDLLQ